MSGPVDEKELEEILNQVSDSSSDEEEGRNPAHTNLARGCRFRFPVKTILNGALSLSISAHKVTCRLPRTARDVDCVVLVQGVFLRELDAPQRILCSDSLS